MKPPKNFYSNLDRRKQGLPELPEASAADVGKVVKVSEDGEYELADDAGSSLPDVSDTDNFKMLQVKNSAYAFTPGILGRSFVVSDSARNVTSSPYTSIRVVEADTGNMTFSFLASTMTVNAISGVVNGGGMNLHFTNKEGNKYIGFAHTNTATTLTGIVHRISDGQLFTIAITSNSYTLTPIGTSISFVVAIAGTTIALPQGCDYTLLSSLISNGVEVILSDDISFYKASKIDSTAETLIFTNMTISSGAVEVKQITVGADGTNTLETVTLS